MQPCTHLAPGVQRHRRWERRCVGILCQEEQASWEGHTPHTIPAGLWHRSGVEPSVIQRTPAHLFQGAPTQVATGMLLPGDVAAWRPSHASHGSRSEMLLAGSHMDVATWGGGSPVLGCRLGARVQHAGRSWAWGWLVGSRSGGGWAWGMQRGGADLGTWGGSPSTK